MSRRTLTVLLAAAVSLGAGGASSGSAAGPSAADRARVVRGGDGYLFIAQDWTVACQDAGQARRVATAARDLAAAVRAGGRSVVVTVGPDKSTPVARRVPRTVPRKACGDASRAALWSQLTTTGGRDFLDLRPALARAGRSSRTYWRKDTHWTPNGGAVFARELARRFDPVLAARLTTRPARWSRDGDLARVLGEPEGETVSGGQLVNPGVRVVELPYTYVGTAHPARRTVALAAPGARVLPGRTLFIGDSFNGTALEQLAPLFAETVFLYPGEKGSQIDPVAFQVQQADRVVVEVVERFAQRYRMFERDAVDALRRVPARPSVG